MKTAKMNRRALLMSVISLILCCAMLIGTTLAWFTDSVSSAGNKIVAGNLDIELKYSHDFKTWTDVEESSLLFKQDTLWEPGHTEVVYLKLSNAGSLALTYTFGTNFENTVVGKNVDGKEIKLSDHLMYKVEDVTEAYASREAAKAAAEGSAKALNAYSDSGYMLPETADKTFALVVYMPETVGNEANYAGNTVPMINLFVNVNATQYTYERDSFGPEYDAGAVFADKSYIADENADLTSILGQLETAEDETVLISLADEMTWATGAGHGSTPWVSENAAVENLIVDAAGNTITATGSGVGAIRMANGGTLTIRNATIVDESVSYAENSWEFGYLEFAGNLVFENVEFVNAISLDGESAIFRNCTFNSNKDSEYAVWVSNGTAEFQNCTFSGARGIKAHEAYGSEVKSVLVNNCTFDNLTKKPGMAIGDVNADTSVIIKNSDFINCQAGDQGKFIYETDTDVTTFTFDVSENNEVIKVVTPDLTITTKEQLFAFANDVNVNANSYAGKLVVLGADIDLNNEEWTPVGQTGGNGVATYFQGMFDGKGYTISNLKITDNAYDEGANYAAGLFGFIDAADAQIVNLNVNGADVNGHHWTGVIAGYITGKISNCTVTNATVTCTHANNDACGDKAGVIVGYVNSGVVTANTVKDCTVTAGRDAGQVVGASKTAYTYGNTAYSTTVSAAGSCTGANIRRKILWISASFSARRNLIPSLRPWGRGIM